MQGKKWTRYLFLFLFAAFIWGYTLADLVTPSREYSELENRYLAKAPAFTVKNLINNTYTLHAEEFTNDQFLLRDAWITLKSVCETALLKIENNGIVYGRDHYMFEKRPGYDEAQLEKNTNAVLAFSEKFKGNQITLMLVPSSDVVLADKTPKGLHNVDQEQIIQNVYTKMHAGSIRAVDLTAVLRENQTPSGASTASDSPSMTFYRTDHHWTTKGAYMAYTAYAKSLQLEPAPLNAYQSYTVPDFYGTFYSKSKFFNAIPDEITWFDIPVTAVTVNGEVKNGLYDTAKWGLRDKYAAFLHGNNGVTVIESGCGPNRGKNEKKRILVFKDSFGNSFAPFLCSSFDEITVIDLRYYTEVEKLLNSGYYDEILFLYGFSSFSGETSIVNLKF